MAATATVGYQNTTDIVLDMTSPVTGTPDVYDIVVTRAFLVTGVTVIAKANQAGGAVTVSKGANLITTDAGGIACAAINTSTSAILLDVAFTTFAVGDTLRISVATNNAQGTIIVRTAPIALGDAKTVVGT